MCGIVGIVDADNGSLTSMLEAIRHRGPDRLSSVRQGDVCLGHVRLSILDLQRGHQPMLNREQTCAVVYNGEVYNYRELKNGFVTGSFETDCDTEVILQLAAHRHPREWIGSLDGMFAFAAVRPGGLLLARDHLGIKPLYLGNAGGRLAFASEIKALLEVATDIAEFPPGHIFTSTDGLEPYYTLSAAASPPDMELPEVLATLRDLITDSVRTRLMADVPVGVFLSGGLDSSIIAACAKWYKADLCTFAVGVEGSRDIEEAERVAKFLGTRHHRRIFTLQDAVNVLPSVIYHLESFDCALVRSAVANYFLAALAREHVKVALSGEGADELFAGYEYLKRLDDVSRELFDITRALHNTNLQRCDRMSMAHGLEVRVPLLDNIRLLEFAFKIPLKWKLYGPGQTEKWILRSAAAPWLPARTVWRKKEKFASGAGLSSHLAAYAEETVSDGDFARQSAVCPGGIRTKEELLYYRMFREQFPGAGHVELVGRSRSV